MTTALEKLIGDLGVRAKYVEGASRIVPGMEDMHPYTVTLVFGSRVLTTPFFTGSAVRLEGRSSPKIAADVLHSLISDAQSFESARDFEDWASDYGFDVDSRKALKIWENVKKMAPKVRKFLGDHFDEFAQAAQDY